MKQSLLLFSLATLLLRFRVNAQPSGACTITEPCKCTYDNGYRIDLTPLENFGGPRFPNLIDGDYTYDVNLCSTFSNGLCYDVTVCQVSNDQSYFTSCGNLDNAAFQVDTDGSLSYYFNNGEAGRTSKVALSCSENDEGAMYAYGDTTELEYDFTLYSRYACPLSPDEPDPDPDPNPDPGDQTKSKTSLSVGSVLIIVFFALLISYFIVGAIIMKFGRHAEGKEIVPNGVFWTALPGLVKEGALFICNKIRGKETGGGGGDAKYDKL